MVGLSEKEFKKTQEGLRRFLQVEDGSIEMGAISFYKVLKGSRRFKKVQEGSSRIIKIQEGSRRFK